MRKRKASPLFCVDPLPIPPVCASVAVLAVYDLRSPEAITRYDRQARQLGLPALPGNCGKTRAHSGEGACGVLPVTRTPEDLFRRQLAKFNNREFHAKPPQSLEWQLIHMRYSTAKDKKERIADLERELLDGIADLQREKASRE